MEQQKNISDWSIADAENWLNGKTWSNGLTPEPHPSINALEFAKQYHANQSLWDKAFAFMAQSDLATLPPEKYALDGDQAYAIITEASSKTFDQSAWEAHEQYLDIQYVISGRERIGVAPISAATVTKPYDESKDYANYIAEGTYYEATPDTFFLFFPADVHRPNIKEEGFDIVKKLVIKIKMAD